MMKNLLFTLSHIDGFNLLPLLKELGSKPAYIFFVIYRIIHHNKIPFFTMIFLSIYFLAFFLFVDVKDIFRYFAHSMLFMFLMLALLKPPYLDFRRFSLISVLILLFLLLSNLFTEIAFFSCEFFSQNCHVSKKISHGITSEPSFLGLSFSLLLYIVFFSKKKPNKNKVFFLFWLGISVTFCIFINSKTGILAFLILLFILLYRSTRKRYLHLIIFPFLFLLVLDINYFEDFVVDRSFLIRGSSSLIALDLFVQNPFFGVGMGQFSEYVYQSAYYNLWFSVQEKSVFLGESRLSTYILFTRILAEGGVGLFIIFILALAMVMRKSVNDLNSTVFFSFILASFFSQDTFLPFMLIILRGFIAYESCRS